ncbi:DUF4352 domain-containing protein [Gordonia sp. NPDC058843]|uniref:DUF4352 domain-containing protein n=1 Tax=Gordonia sp. NPDC058843 TaxID=3346648 RepID=UPI00367986FD
MTDPQNPQNPAPGHPGQPGQQPQYGAPPPGQPYGQTPPPGAAQYGQAPYGAPPQPYPPQPYPAPPARKKKKWPWVLGALVVLLIIILAATSGGGSEDTDTTADSGASTATEQGEPAGADSEDAVPGLNTPVRDGKFEFVVTGVEPGLTSVGDNPYLTEEAQGQFVVVTMSVKNTSDQPQSFSPTGQKLFDAEDRSFEPDTTAQIALGGSDIPVWDNINPGNAVTVKLVYDMPAGATPASIELHDSMFSGGVTVNLG